MPGGRIVGRADLMDRTVAAALALLGAAAVVAAVRLGAAAGAGREDLLAELRARTEQRIAGERERIRPALEAWARGERDAALALAEGDLPRLEGNSQLHLLLAGAYREQGKDAAALRQYRRAVEITREYADRRASCYLGDDLGAWLAAAGGRLSAPGGGPAAAAALADLGYLRRALAGGCS